MNRVTIEPKLNTVDVQYQNFVNIEVIRIHTDYYFMTYSQTTPEHKEV